jgi:hypothetical protein
MNSKSIPVLALVLLAVVFSFSSCKTLDEAGSLTVIVSEGVSGTPQAGLHNLIVGKDIGYSFELDAGYEKLTVLLDGAEVAAAGTVTISGDHELQAYADDNGQFTLTVSLDAGVKGTPAAGTYTYKQGTKVEYAYGLEEGYADLVVELDGTEVESQGSITISGDCTLGASDDSLYNIQGAWEISETYDDESSFEVTAVFSGNYSSGTVTDSDGGSGTYAVDADQAVTFGLGFPDVTYDYEGDFSDEDTMSGTCERYQTSDNVISGTWTATRVTSGTTAFRPAPGPGRKGSVKRLRVEY